MQLSFIKISNNLEKLNEICQNMSSKNVKYI